MSQSSAVTAVWLVDLSMDVESIADLISSDGGLDVAALDAARHTDVTSAFSEAGGEVSWFQLMQYLSLGLFMDCGAYLHFDWYARVSQEMRSIMAKKLTIWLIRAFSTLLCMMQFDDSSSDSWRSACHGRASFWVQLPRGTHNHLHVYSKVFAPNSLEHYAYFLSLRCAHLIFREHVLKFTFSGVRDVSVRCYAFRVWFSLWSTSSSLHPPTRTS